MGKPKVSIVICTYERPESLDETLQSLSKQSFRNFEVLLLTEKGNLSELRDRGLYLSAGVIVCFIDDDVYCPPTWLQAVVETFEEEGVVGVTGPTIITTNYRRNRDIFKYKRIRAFTDWVFQVPSIPSTLSPCGTPSMLSNDADCRYTGPVQYLEACNMSVKKKEALIVKGFDHKYYRTSEWCELDLSLKLGQKGRLISRPECGLHHRPSQAGVYKARLSTRHRWHNFVRFQRRWVKPSLRRHLYWGFVWAYLKMKDLRMI